MRRKAWLSKNKCEKHEGQDGNGMWRKAGSIVKGLRTKVEVGFVKTIEADIGFYVNKSVSS